MATPPRGSPSEQHGVARGRGRRAASGCPPAPGSPLPPQAIHTRATSKPPSKQNIPSYTPRFSPSYLLTPHPSSFINLPPSQLLIVDPTRHSHSLFFFHTFVPVPSLLCFFPTSTASQPGSPPARRTQDLHRRAGPPSPLSTLTSPVRHSGGSIAPARHLRPSASSPPRRSMARRAPPPRAPAAESSWGRRHSFHPCSRRPLSLWRRSSDPAAGSFPPSPPTCSGGVVRRPTSSS
jgi:hypothetical protein